jgi:hypothetical protein
VDVTRPRHLLFAVIALILSVLPAVRADSALGLPALVVGFAGRLALPARVLLKRGRYQQSAADSTVGSGAIAGIVLATVLSTASGVVGESAPLVLAAAARGRLSPAWCSPSVSARKVAIHPSSL